MSRNVFLLIHDDRWYEMGDTYVCGVYATREAAEAHVKTKTKTPYGTIEHNEDCCAVEEREVEE